VLRGLLIGVAVALIAPTSAFGGRVQVVVRLDAPGLAQAVEKSRALSSASKQRRLDLRAAPSRAYLAELDAAHLRFERALSVAVPSARVRWNYRIVLNALAVVVRDRDVGRLAKLPGVRDVLPSAGYDLNLDQSPGVIGADRLWNDSLSTRGDGMKIGILDDGVDQSHPFFNPGGYAMPAGFPKGQTAFTTSKVIVARAFPPPGASSPHAGEPFDPDESGHGTHVAGIAAGNPGTPTSLGLIVSGVAPRAYIGNYRVMTVRSNVGLNGNAPEIARAVEAAVADGMDVINLSLGEHEIEPSRDVLALALNAAAAAGVVPVASAGNSGTELGEGSISSPASAARAIAVGAAAAERTSAVIASFSSIAPSPLSLRMKPDLVAPGVAILSSTPFSSSGPSTGWEVASGASMASPHIAAAAALLLQRNPQWTSDQVKSALVSTATSVRDTAVARQGAGLVNVAAAAAPLIFTRPTAISFGIARPRERVRAAVRLTDAGGGAGTWRAAIVSERGGRSELSVQVPGTLAVSVQAPAAEGASGGVVELRRGDAVRRIPFLVVVARPDLPRPSLVLRRVGSYAGSTLGRPSTVRRYRFPDIPRQALAGPEQVVRFVLRRNAANLGVAVTSGAVEPRIVRRADENRLAGATALPVNTNPYSIGLDRPVPIAAVLRPRRGVYDLVFDSRTRGSRFTYRVWIDDRTPPSARFVSTTASGGAVRVRVADSGSGVDRTTLVAAIGERRLPVSVSRNVATIDVRGLRSGTYALVFEVADRQEAKNDENVAGVLPNTRRLRATVRVP
jgi:subtilisin family serine protease